MLFSNFHRTVETQITGHDIVETVSSYQHTIQLTSNGVVLIDREKTSHKDIKEAVESVKQNAVNVNLRVQIQQELYNNISVDKISSIIKQHTDERVTDTLIESYVSQALDKMFNVNPIVHDIKKLNKSDKIVEGMLDYKLNDGSVVVIRESTQHQLNSLFKDHPDVVSHMCKSHNNFLNVINLLEV